MKRIKNVISICSLLLLLFQQGVYIAYAQEASDSAQTGSPSATTVTTPTPTPFPTIIPSPQPGTQNPFNDEPNQAVSNVNIPQAVNNSLQSSLTPASQNGSAIALGPISVETISKKTFQQKENISLTVANATASEITVDILDHAGRKVTNIPVEKTTDGTNVAVTLIPPQQDFIPGKYTIQISDAQGVISTQDFSWGVLAINPDKSIYLPSSTAHIGIAVLDDSGNMVCNAAVTLAITDPSGNTTTLSTPDGVQVTSQCLSHAISNTPDYQATYLVNGVGNYTLSLSATTKNGTYTIQDGFQVAQNVPFVLDRYAPTRIYPINSYPVTFDITANQDFTGTVKEYVPASFTVTPLTNDTGTTFPQFSEQIITDHNANVLSVGYLSMPFDGNYKITQGFGVEVTDPGEKALYVQYGLKGHDGLDFGVPMSTPIKAVDDGKVVLAGESAYGITIVIQHSWGKSYYGHLGKLYVNVGQQVERGDLIALSGNSGLSTGEHLHFGIKPNNADINNGYFGKIDPTPYLDFPHTSTKIVATTSSLDANWKEIDWQVSVKKGDIMHLGYTFQAPSQSPQFYNLGPLQFFYQDSGFVFGEIRQWEIASDASTTLYMTSTAAASPYPTQSWTFSTTANASSNTTTFAENKKSVGVVMFNPGATNTTVLSGVSSLPTTVNNTGWIYTGTTFDGMQTDAGTWTVNYKYSVVYSSAPTTKVLWYRVLKVTCSSGSCSSNAVISPTDASAPANSGWAQTTIGTLPSSGTLSGAQSLTFSGPKTIFASGDKVYVEFAIQTSSTGSNTGGWHLEANTSSDSVVTSNVSTPPPVLNEVHYRWRNDDGNEAAATWRRIQDTADNKNYSNGNIRLRVEISNKTGGSSATNYTYRLEYGSESSLGNCSSVSSWTAVPTSGSTDFNVTTSSYVSNGTATTAQLTADSTNFVAGQVMTSNNITGNITLAKTTDYTEIEYSIQPAVNAGNTGKSFCFRLTNAGSTTNFTYTVYPELTVGQPTVVQNHFIFRNDNGPESTTTGNTIYMSPVGNGFATNFTIAAGCTSNWQCVNDNTSHAGTSSTAPTSDGATSALTTAAANDYYTLSQNTIPSRATITDITLSAYAIKNSNPGGTMTLGYCLSGNCGTSDVMGTGQSVSGSSYAAFTQDFPGLSLTLSDLNGMQLIVQGSNTRVNVSTLYVLVTYSLPAATSMASQDANVTGVTLDSILRLRVEAANTGGVAGTRNLELQYAIYSSGSCGAYTVIPVSTSSLPFEMSSSSYFTNGSATTTQLTATGTFEAGKMVENPSNSSGPMTMNATSYTEDEYMLHVTKYALPGVTYCFELADTSQGALDSYTAIPMISTVPTLDQLLRHGQWFNNGIIQPFTF